MKVEYGNLDVHLDGEDDGGVLEILKRGGAGAGDVRTIKPGGPVSKAYLLSNAFLRMIVGPYGSGKTFISCFDGIVKTQRQPRMKDGWRHAKGLMVRDTYANLYSTLVPTLLNVTKSMKGKFTGGGNRPGQLRLEWADQYGPISLVLELDALGGRDVKAVLDGYEPTFIFCNAWSTLPEEVLTYSVGRVGRYPPREQFPEGKFAHSYVYGDTNSFDEEHYLSNFEDGEQVVKLRDGSDLKLERRVFWQPGGLAPEAENLDHLEPGYYERMAFENQHRQWWVRIYVHNKKGQTRHGDPVWPEFDDAVHVAKKDYDAPEGASIVLATDGGKTLHPAALFLQRAGNGQIRVLDELSPETYGRDRAGASAFAEMMTQKLSEPHLARGIVADGVTDPVSDMGADKEGGESSWLEVLEKELGINIRLAPTNELNPRIDIVSKVLKDRFDGRTPTLSISPRCKGLIKAMNSKYIYLRTKTPMGEEPKDKPTKSHPWSDYADCLQYGMLHMLGMGFVAENNRHLMQGRRVRATRAQVGADFDVFSV